MNNDYHTISKTAIFCFVLFYFIFFSFLIYISIENHFYMTDKLDVKIFR